MSNRWLLFWRGLAGFGISLLILTATGSFWLSLIVAAAVIWCLCGAHHVPDNTALPLYWLRNYWKSVGPGFHWIPWPIVSGGDLIDTRYSQTRCQIEGASSEDRIPFVITLEFAYRFIPQRVSNRQKAHEIISNGPAGRRDIAQEAARNASLYISRRFNHLQLMSGTQQALIQGQIVQEAAQRLAASGFDVLTTAFRAIFTGPKDLNVAYVQQQAARPNAQGAIVHMTELLEILKKYGTPEIHQYLDLFMVRAMGNQNVDPLSAMLAQEWFHRFRGGSQGTP